MIDTPIYNGRLQSDMDFAGYRALNMDGSGDSTVTINVKDPPYSATGDGVIDDTAAVQNALNALAAANGGVLFFPKGTYLCNGPFDGTTNSILKIPFNPSTNPLIVIEIRGENPGTWISYDSNMSSSGAIIKSTKTGSGIAPCILAAAAYHDGLSAPLTSLFNYVTVYIRDMTFRTYDNPSIGAIGLGMAAGASLENVTVDTGVNQMSLTQPTHGTFGVWMPNTNNFGLNFCNRVIVGGYSTGIKTGEHFIAPYGVVARCSVGVEFLFGYHPSQGHLNIFHTNTYLKFSAQHAVDVVLDVERATSGWWAATPGNDVVDSGNVATGEIRYIIVKEAVGNLPDPISVTGAAGIRFINLYTGGLVTVAQLPVTPLIGQTAAVSDGTASLPWGVTVTGGGSTKYLVWWNGANWTVAGK